jgi:DNA-binding protein HU-beta
MAKLMSKSELIQRIADQHSNGLSRKDIKGVIESLADVGYKELKKTGAFFVPGFAKFVVIKKPATKARKGINPFTKDHGLPDSSRTCTASRAAFALYVIIRSSWAHTSTT